MSQYTMIHGFDESANIVLNKAIQIANKHNSEELNTVHLGYALLTNKDVIEDFTEKTGINGIEFRESVIGPYLINNLYRDKRNRQIDFTDMSNEMSNIITGTINRLDAGNGYIRPIDIYKTLVTNVNTEMYSIFISAGIDMSVFTKSANILDELHFLSEVGVDLNNLAKNKKTDPVESRDDIVDTVIEVLGRRQAGNPCLIGDAGVGKTAIIEDIARRIVEGKVPSFLKNKNIVSVDISAIVAGARFRGDFEEKLNNIINEVKRNNNVILFFDEFHLITNGGSSAESGLTASNILKPILARGEIRVIGATTTEEYKKHIEKDKAFARRIQPIMVKEPTVDEAIKMMEKLAPIYSKYHNVIIPKDAIVSSVILSDKYITTKKLPEKAVAVLDETAARIKLFNDGRISTISDADIKKTISKITGIEVTNMDKTEKERLINLENRLRNCIIGQDQAVKEVSTAIKRNKAGIRRHTKPIGSFLFVGPTGVGKTELCKALSRELFGSEKAIIRLDMSEYMEKHSVSKLTGSPPGYIGHDDGGQLTDRVKRRPYSIILLDEIEKAHPDVFNMFLQVMDEGTLTDSKGETTDFKNTLIIMTSNAGYTLENQKKGSMGFISEKELNPKIDEKETLKNLESIFRPEFLNRLDKVVVFNKLTKENIENIVKLMLNESVTNLKADDITVRFNSSVLEFICAEGFSEKYGARNIRRKIQDTLEDYLADLILRDELKPDNIITLDASNGILTHKITVNEKVCCL